MFVRLLRLSIFKTKEIIIIIIINWGTGGKEKHRSLASKETLLQTRKQEEGKAEPSEQYEKICITRTNNVQNLSKETNTENIPI